MKTTDGKKSMTFVAVRGVKTVSKKRRQCVNKS